MGSSSRTPTRRLHAVLMMALVGCLDSCRREEPVQPAPALDVRPVRVLLADAVPRCRVRVDGAYVARDASGRVLAQGERLNWSDVTCGSGVRLGDADPVDDALVLEGVDGALIAFTSGEAAEGETRSYAGTLEFAARSGDALRVINHVDLEAYVAGVVSQESWPSFHDEALKAQAIAARTYVLYLMSEREDRPFDVRAGEGDQVYRGVRLDEFGSRVASAVDATRGIVLAAPTREGLRIFCAYYAAACGGRSQSVSDVQGGPAPEPLRGGVACDWCKIAKGDAYRWGPVRVSKTGLLARLKERDQTIADWPRIETVSVSRTGAYGRIVEVTLTSVDGRSAVLRGEPFRLAVGSRAMRSTDCTLTDAGDELLLENGKGFGHGLGMCQWGAEGQARDGKRGGEILLHYYPGAQIVRAY